MDVHPRDGSHDRGADQGLVTEFAGDTGGAVIENLLDGERRSAGPCGIGLLEELHQEARHLLGRCGLAIGPSRLELRPPIRDSGAHERDDHGDSDRARRCHGDPVSTHEESNSIQRVIWTGNHRLMAPQSLEVRNHLRSRGIAQVPMMGESLAHDPIEAAGDRVTQLCGRRAPALRDLEPTVLHQSQGATRRHRVVAARGRQLVRQHTHQQAMEHQTEGVDVRPGVDILTAQGLRAQVIGGADDPVGQGVRCFVGRRVVERLGNAEVDDLGQWASLLLGNEDVRRLEVAVDDALLVRVLYARTDRLEDLQAIADTEATPVAVRDQGSAGHVLHGDVGRSVVGGAGVEYLGNGGMTHTGEGPRLGTETQDRLPILAAEANHLEGHPAANGLALLGQVDHAHSALTEHLGDAIGTDDLGGGLGQSLLDVRHGGGMLQEGVELTLVGEHLLEICSHLRVALARACQQGFAFDRPELDQLEQESVELPPAFTTHGPPLDRAAAAATGAPRPSPAPPWRRKRPAPRRSPCWTGPRSSAAPPPGPDDG